MRGMKQKKCVIRRLNYSIAMYATILLLFTGVTGCGNDKTISGKDAVTSTDENTERVTRKIFKKDIQTKWDLVTFYMGMVEDVTDYLGEVIGKESDRVGEALINEKDVKIADGYAKDTDFLVFSMLTIQDWVDPIGNAHVAAFQYDKISDLETAFTAEIGSPVSIDMTAEGDTVEYDLKFDLADEDGTMHSCSMSFMFNIAEFYWSMVQYDGEGNAISFFRFQCLGDDRYAISNQYMRALLTYNDKTGSFSEIDAGITTNTVIRFKEATGLDNPVDTPYVYESDGLLPLKKDALNAEWVTEAEKVGGLFRHMVLDGDMFIISGLSRDPFNGQGLENARFVEEYRMELPVSLTAK